MVQERKLGTRKTFISTKRKLDKTILRKSRPDVSEKNSLPAQEQG